MAHTLHEDRDLNSPKELFDELSGGKSTRRWCSSQLSSFSGKQGSMIQVTWRTATRTRLRAMIDAKLKGEGIDLKLM